MSEATLLGNKVQSRGRRSWGELQMRDISEFYKILSVIPKPKRPFGDVSNEAGDLGIFTLIWSVGNVVASGRTHKTWAKQFSLAEGLAMQGIQLWVLSNQHSQQLGMLRISMACGCLTPAPTLVHTCVLWATFSNEFARLGTTPPGVWSISFPV